MARGGYRVGAGRPKGSGKGKARPQHAAPQARPAVAAPDASVSTSETIAQARKLPLAYMLDVMNDPEVDQARRDRMAIAAAPFVHRRAAEEEKGKKEQRQAEAATAQTGTDWEDDLARPANRLQ